MSKTLRSKVIRLAYTNPELQPHLLPILEREASFRLPSWARRWFNGLDTSFESLALLLLAKEAITDSTHGSVLRATSKWLTTLSDDITGGIDREVARILKEGLQEIPDAAPEGKQRDEGTVEQSRLTTPHPASVVEYTSDYEVHAPEALAGTAYVALNTDWIVPLVAKGLRRLNLKLSPRDIQEWVAAQNQRDGEIREWVDEACYDQLDGEEIALDKWTQNSMSEAAREATSYDISDPDGDSDAPDFSVWADDTASINGWKVSSVDKHHGVELELDVVVGINVSA